MVLPVAASLILGLGINIPNLWARSGKVYLILLYPFGPTWAREPRGTASSTQRPTRSSAFGTPPPFKVSTKAAGLVAHFVAYGCESGTDFYNTPDGKGHRLVARFIGGELVKTTHTLPDWLRTAMNCTSNQNSKRNPRAVARVLQRHLTELSGNDFDIDPSG